MAERRRVKRKQRIEIQIERRELSIVSSLASNSGAGEKNKARESSELLTGGRKCGKPERCLTCGSTDMMLLSDARTLATLGSLRSDSSAVLINCHVQCSSSDEWWVCRPSLDLS
jgi:hypothetical protein